MGDTIGTGQAAIALPFERGAKPPADVEKGLVAALEADGTFASLGDDEQPETRGTEPEESEPEGEPEDELEGEPEDESEQDEEPEAEAEEPEAEPLYEVNGEKVTLQGLRDGYLRQTDYTRKTMELADERRKVQAEATELRGKRDRYAEQLEALALALKEAQPKEPDWDKLRAENPNEYLLQRADWERVQERRRSVEAEQSRLYEERLADFNQQQEAFKAEQMRLLNEAVPEWKDEEKAKAEKGQLFDYLTSLGYTEQELDSVHDHRLMVLLRKAYLYDQGQTTVKDKIREKVKPAGQPLRPGSRERTPVKAQVKAVKAARARLARTGRADDAAAWIENLID